MRVFHSFREFFVIEVPGKSACSKILSAEIDSVRAIADGRFQRIKVSRRG